MPEPLKTAKKRLAKLKAEEDAAFDNNDFARSAELKSERLKLAKQYEADRLAWRQSSDLDDVVEAEDIAAVYIAGGFGNHVRGQDAVDLGLLPEIPEEKIQFIGNAALSGAEAVLLSRQAREKAEFLAQKVEYVEASEKPDFQDLYVDSMHFAAGEI